MVAGARGFLRLLALLLLLLSGHVEARKVRGRIAAGKAILDLKPQRVSIEEWTSDARCQGPDLAW